MIRSRICGRLFEVPVGRYTECQQKYSVNKSSTIDAVLVANYGQTDACLNGYWTATIGEKRNSPPVVATFGPLLLNTTELNFGSLCGSLCGSLVQDVSKVIEIIMHRRCAWCVHAFITVKRVI